MSEKRDLKFAVEFVKALPRPVWYIASGLLLVGLVLLIYVLSSSSTSEMELNGDRLTTEESVVASDDSQVDTAVVEEVIADTPTLVEVELPTPVPASTPTPVSVDDSVDTEETDEETETEVETSDGEISDDSGMDVNSEESSSESQGGQPVIDEDNDNDDDDDDNQQKASKVQNISSDEPETTKLVYVDRPTANVLTVRIQSESITVNDSQTGTSVVYTIPTFAKSIDDAKRINAWRDAITDAIQSNSSKVVVIEYPDTPSDEHEWGKYSQVEDLVYGFGKPYTVCFLAQTVTLSHGTINHPEACVLISPK